MLLSPLLQNTPILAPRTMGTPAVNRTPIAVNRISLQRQRSQPHSYAASTTTSRCCLPQRSRSFFRCYAVAGTQAETQTARPIYRDELTDPAHIGSSTLSQLVVQDRGGSICLGKYMTLPIEQYDELDPNMIQSLGGPRYSLKVPRTALFNVWVEPIVEVEVSLQQLPGSRGVLIKATNWGLRGSELIENLNLGRRFSLDFTAELTWTTAAETEAEHSMQSLSTQLNSESAGPGQIQGKVNLDVYSEVLGPFQIIPRSVLEAGGNAVMRTLAGQLLPVFLRRLAADYDRWAEDPVYRQRRAQ